MAQLVMMRPLEAGRPPDPGQIQVRQAAVQDAGGLLHVLQAAFPELEWSHDRVLRDLLEAEDVSHVFVAEVAGAIAGTASARRFSRFPDSGYVHWVGVDPTYRGRGLSNALVTRVIGQFFDDGRPKVFLETDDQRLPAISSYLSLGFIPHYRDSDHEQRWSKVFAAIAQSRRLGAGR